MTTKEDHLQFRLNKSIKERQSQEESTKNLTATFKQDRSLHSDQQTTERQTACQLTLHNVENPTYCMDECENLRNDISIHGPRSQGPRTLLFVFTEATNLAARSLVRQFCNTADT